MKRLSVQILAPAVISALALLRIAVGDPASWTGRAPSHEEAGPAQEASNETARRLLGGLDVGERVAALEVARVGALDNGSFVVELRDGDRGARVWIRRSSERERPAAVREGGFDFLYGPPVPGLDEVGDEAAREAALALAARVAASGLGPEDVGLAP